MRLYLRLQLRSDATFGRGDGVAGLVDAEVEHDVETGLPYIRGRTIKGLLVEECANILYALGRHDQKKAEQLDQAAETLFGRPGSTAPDAGKMHVGPAALPQELQDAVRAQVGRNDRNRLRPDEVLESLTAIRRQTAVDEERGAPKEGSLRSMRVVLRETTFEAPLDFTGDPGEEARVLLAACALSLRRAGTGRNRGRGRLAASLWDESRQKDVTADAFAHFKVLVTGGAT